MFLSHVKRKVKYHRLTPHAKQYRGDDILIKWMHRRSGFTIVELMVACSVMSVVLLGVYSVFQQALAAEQTMSGRVQSIASARSIADHIADSLLHSVNIDSMTTVHADQAEEGGFYLVCMRQTQPFVRIHVQEYEPVIGYRAPNELLRYRWGFSEKDDKGSLTLQRMWYAGTENLMTGAGQADGKFEWSQVPARIIGLGLDEISIRFRTADNSNAKWEKKWKDQTGNVLIWIKVTVNQETAERVVMPAANGLLIEGSN